MTLFCSLFRLDQVVYAKTDTAAHSKGITAFIIEKDMPGYDNFSVSESTLLSAPFLREKVKLKLCRLSGIG